jgi:RNA polymerase sigma factor (sigma-70 family)
MTTGLLSGLLACSVVLLPALRSLPSGTATRQHPPHISMVAQFRPEALTRDAPSSSSTITKDKPRRASTTPSKAPPPSTTSPATTSLSRGPTKGVPVKAPPVAVDPLLTGEDLVRSPNVFRGFSPSGEQLERLPLLTRDEELTLVRAAWFFTAAADARRDLEADASVGRPAPNHVDIVAAVHHRHKTAGGASPALAALLPPLTMSDTDFRLRESRGRAAYNKLFLHNQGLIYHEVNKIMPNWRDASVIEKADFLQEGAQGLLRAIRLFDPARPVRFATYAAWHVRAHVLRSVRDKAHLVRLPQNLQADMHQIKRARYRCAQRRPPARSPSPPPAPRLARLTRHPLLHPRYAVENQGERPRSEDLASMLQWEVGRVTKAEQGLTSAQFVSLDDEGLADGGYVGASAAASGGGGRTNALKDRVTDMRADMGGRGSENRLFRQQLVSTLRQAMLTRDPARVELTRLRYGLEDGEEWSYPALAERFNITTSGAKGIVRSELAFLRNHRGKVLQQFKSQDGYYDGAY